MKSFRESFCQYSFVYPSLISSLLVETVQVDSRDATHPRGIIGIVYQVKDLVELW